jgi:hypothetical protein
MKKGFLGSHDQQHAAASTAAVAASRQPTAPVADAPQKQPPQPAVSAGAAAEAAGQDVQQSANWKQCMELLRSDVDEKK